MANAGFAPLAALAPLASLVLVLPACSSSASAGPAASSDADAAVDASAEQDPDAGEPDPSIVARPYDLREPAGYDARKAAPLLIGLHGYGPGDNAKAFEQWLKLAPIASQRGWLYALPSGTLDRSKLPFWNGTDSCCNFDKSKVDDVAYIAALIDDVARTHALDRERVFVLGVSGGGFMAHRLACDLSDRIAAVVSVSGATWKDAARCKPTAPIAVLELHGDADDAVQYDGGTILGMQPFPGARETAAHWKSYADCTGDLHESTERPPLDLELELEVSGAETHVETFDSCARGTFELWTAKGGPHAPHFTPAFAPTVFDWFERHARPH